MRNLLKYVGWFLVSTVIFNVAFELTGVPVEHWWQPFVFGLASGAVWTIYFTFIKKQD